MLFRNSARHKQTGAVTVGKPHESAAKQTSLSPAQASWTKGDGVGSQLGAADQQKRSKAGLQQEEKQNHVNLDCNEFFETFTIVSTVQQSRTFGKAGPHEIDS